MLLLAVGVISCAQVYGADRSAPELDEYFNDPDVKLMSQSKDEWARRAEVLQESVRGKLVKDVPELLFELLQIRILQCDEIRAKNIVSYLLQIDAQVITNSVKNVQAKNRKMSAVMAASLSNITTTNKAAYQRFSSLILDHASLIGKIKGKTQVMASLARIELPADFHSL